MQQLDSVTAARRRDLTRAIHGARCCAPSASLMQTSKTASRRFVNPNGESPKSNEITTNKKGHPCGVTLFVGLVDLKGQFSSQVFKVLEEWNTSLKHVSVDLTTPEIL